MPGQTLNITNLFTVLSLTHFPEGKNFDNSNNNKKNQTGQTVVVCDSKRFDLTVLRHYVVFLENRDSRDIKQSGVTDRANTTLPFPLTPLTLC